VLFKIELQFALSGGCKWKQSSISVSLSLLLPHASVVGRDSQLPPSHRMRWFAGASAQLYFACTTFRTVVNVGVSWLVRELNGVLLAV
jgi:hypothetical protein